MPKLNFIQSQIQNRSKRADGVVVASLFAVPKIGGLSLKWKNKTRNAEGKLVDISSEDLLQNLLETGCFGADDKGRSKGMLCLKNSRKREDRKDPEYIVYAYPTIQEETKE